MVIFMISSPKSIRFDRRNRMLVLVLVVTALLVSDVAGTHNSLELGRTQRHLEKRDLTKGPCDKNWFHFPPLNSCYQFFSDEMTWEEAQDFCNEQQCCGQLASVNSDQLNTFVSDVVSVVDQEKPRAWIGLNDICKDGKFTWIDGSSYSYRNFGPGEPNNYNGREDCVNIHHFRNLTWNDAPCNMKIGFVCSYKLC
ncbi:C-type lectin lectoxin-Phi1-like isoform X1 [Mobula hypostoma]|uniref:C-type lectin lectoxin-Phi1-like isoform X1 n=2 Tax=Mobula hypostoma TaxID=723540 RepID=UPI002FC2C545